MSKEKINDHAFATRMQKLLRENFNNNNSEFARTVGVAVTSLNRWISGEADPSRTNLVRVSKACGVSLLWLATGEEPASNTITEQSAPYKATRKPLEGEMIVDIEKFKEAIETLEEILAMTNKTMDAEGRAKMTFGIYELLTKPVSEKEKMVGVLKLVA